MDNNLPETQKPIISEPQVASTKKRSKLPLVLLVIVLMATTGAGGYLLANSSKQDGAKNTQASQSTTPSDIPANETHIIRSTGYPFDLKGKKLITTFSLPDTIQAVRISSDNNNRGTAERALTDKYNDELERLVVGYPQSAEDGAAAGPGDISLVAISKSWLSASSPGNVEPDSFDKKLVTPKEKSAYIASLKQASATCVNDPKKGFSTKDGSLSVCYTLNFGKDGYSPTISLSGYGEVTGQPLVLYGFIPFYDSTRFSDLEAERKAITDANNGIYTKDVSTALAALLKALPQTTITVADNPLTAN